MLLLSYGSWPALLCVRRYPPVRPPSNVSRKIKTDQTPQRMCVCSDKIVLIIGNPCDISFFPSPSLPLDILSFSSSVFSNIAFRAYTRKANRKMHPIAWGARLANCTKSKIGFKQDAWWNKHFETTRTTFMFESILRFVYESSCDTNLWRYILLLLLLMPSVTNITHDITIITPLHSACTCFFLKLHCSTARTTEVEPFLMTYTGVEVYFVPQFYHHHCYASPKSEGTMITFGLGFPSNV